MGQGFKSWLDSELNIKIDRPHGISKIYAVLISSLAHQMCHADRHKIYWLIKSLIVPCITYCDVVYVDGMGFEC